jgi:hypothetical protein
MIKPTPAYGISATANVYCRIRSSAPPSCRNWTLNVTPVTDRKNSKVQKKESDRARLAGQTESDRRERQMLYLVNVTNERPMLRISATIVLAFTCAAPLILLFSDLVAHGVRALIQ